jgi:hypothetical protein
MNTEPPALLFGPYLPPSVRKGERVSCLHRDCDVVVIDWSDAPIPWPLCRRVERGGGIPSILVDDELARAIRNESGQALCYWWGVSTRIVWRWRKSLGVARMDSEGSRRLILAASERGAARVRGQPVPAHVSALLRRVAIEKGLVAKKPNRWTEEEIDLLGTDRDKAIAAQVGRTPAAVRLMRARLGIAAGGCPTRAAG